MTNTFDSNGLYGDALNDFGQIGGGFIDPLGNFGATFWNGERLIDLGTPNGFSQSNVHAINNVGMSVGHSWNLLPPFNTSTAGHATAWLGNDPVDLNTFLDAAIVDSG